MNSPHPLVGVWRLLSCEHRLVGGRIMRPFGKRPEGRLIYSSGGRMMVMIMDPRRPRGASGQLFEANASELAVAAAGFIAYSARWKAVGGRVFHEVDISLFPNWIGGTQIREFKITGRKVRFSTKPFSIKGVTQTASLVWERVKG